MKTTTVLMVAVACIWAGQLSAAVPGAGSFAEPDLLVLPAEPNPLCQAILKGELSTVQRLIRQGEDLNKRSLGKTPLIFAARYNRPEIARLLLEHGADPKRRCARGYSPEWYARQSGATEVLALLEIADAKG